MVNNKINLFLIIAAVILGGVFVLYKSNSLKISDYTNTAEKINLTDEELKKEIGQMLMIGFRGTEALEDSDISKIIKDVKVGGVVLFDYDMPSSSFPRNIVNPEQTKKLILNLQKYSEDSLFISVDAEGGNVNRLKPKYGFLSIVSQEQMGADKTLKTTEEESIKLSEELKGLGFNMNLAPVVDLNINPENPIIGVIGRSFSSNPEEVTNQARIFIQNHLKNNIITVEKHFPGQGSATEDSHLGMVDVTSVYKEEELIPYQKLNDEGLLDAVMVAHVVNKKIDEKYPATLSSTFLQNILRNQIGFKGVVISDDMQMAAIAKNYKLDQAIILAINAGCDVISVLNNSKDVYDNNMAYNVRDIIFNAVKENKIKEERITESYNRIIDLKKKFKIIISAEEKKDNIAKIKDKNFELLGVSQTMTFDEAFSSAKYVAEKVKIRPAFLLAILQEELTLEKTDLCYLTDLKTGKGVRSIDGKVLLRTMNPERDIPGFLKITKELGKDPLKTLVTCPMSFGWGGAMGPADFIPSTWLKYENQVEKITGKPADPWNIQDALLAAGIYLSESGANLENRDGEWKAAMIYFSGSISSPYVWYANGTLEIADKIQADIDIIESGD